MKIEDKLYDAASKLEDELIYAARALEDVSEAFSTLESEANNSVDEIIDLREALRRAEEERDNAIAALKKAPTVEELELYKQVALGLVGGLHTLIERASKEVDDGQD